VHKIKKADISRLSVVDKSPQAVRVKFFYLWVNAAEALHLTATQSAAGSANPALRLSWAALTPRFCLTK
jgi:hypothetical protein